MSGLGGLVRASVLPPETAADDPRIGHALARNRLGDHTRVVLVGFPTDVGVRRNGGRPGAAEGPRALREALGRMTPDPRHPGFADLLARTVDAGDVPVSDDLAADQARLGAVVAEILARGAVAVVLGGGHETALGQLLGHDAPADVLNWDAHADVRPRVLGPHGTPVGHSGSPFREAIDAGRVRRYTAAGLHAWRVSAAHAAYVAAHGEAVWQDDLTPARADALVARLAAPAAVSFDLDAVDAGAAPGVSAPGVGGVALSEWLRRAEACGRHPAVASASIVELNPAHDAGGRTAALAALTVWHLLRGIARR